MAVLNILGSVLVNMLVDTVATSSFLTRNRYYASRQWERIEATLPSCSTRRLDQGESYLRRHQKMDAKRKQRASQVPLELFQESASSTRYTKMH